MLGSITTTRSVVSTASSSTGRSGFSSRLKTVRVTAPGQIVDDLLEVEGTVIRRSGHDIDVAVKDTQIGDVVATRLDDGIEVRQQRFGDDKGLSGLAKASTRVLVENALPSTTLPSAWVSLERIRVWSSADISKANALRMASALTSTCVAASSRMMRPSMSLPTLLRSMEPLSESNR